MQGCRQAVCTEEPWPLESLVTICVNPLQGHWHVGAIVHTPDMFEILGRFCLMKLMTPNLILQQNALTTAVCCRAS